MDTPFDRSNFLHWMTAYLGVKRPATKIKKLGRVHLHGRKDGKEDKAILSCSWGRSASLHFVETWVSAGFLLLARYGKNDEPQSIIPKVSQETLAEMIGTTRSRVNLFMNKFKKLGFIHYEGGLRVHNSLLNVVLHK